MYEAAIVGAGPIGLEVAWELKRAGIDRVVHFDRSQIASTIHWFPTEMTFFSSADRIAICGIPIQTPGQRKCTKEEYLAYLRTVAQARDLPVRTYEAVTGIVRDGDGFALTTTRDRVRARRVVLATGDMTRPRHLDVPGADLPHVHHRFDDPHAYFRRRLLVVGGKNSAVEAALRCWHAGVDVALSYRGAAFPEKSVKYWLLPELKGRIYRGEIGAHMETVPVEIREGSVTLARGDQRFDVDADFVLPMIGFEMDTTLFELAGVTLDGTRPVHDPATMETDVPGVFVAGTATAGSQRTYTLFIENCHIHATRIAAAITGAPPPPDPPPLRVPES